MKKIFALFLSLVMMATAVPAVFAIDTTDRPEGASNEVEQTVNLGERLIVQVEPGKATFSEKTNKMLDSVSQNVEQVVYQVDAGKDTFTIGFDPGSTTFSIDEMNQGIQNMVESLKQDIQSDPDLQGNHIFEVQDLELTQVIFDATKEEQTNIKEKISPIIESMQTAEDIMQYGLLENVAESISSIASKSITGSKHVLRTVSGGGNTAYTSIWWHNQLTNTDTECFVTPTSPHKGDGNARYNAGYKWYPTTVRTWFKNSVTTGKNRITLKYSYSPTQLSYLQQDSDEALEIAVQLYNYQNVSNASDRGCTYMLHRNMTWSTNQPNAYKDTAFGDDENIVDFCMGVEKANSLKSNTTYYWTVDADAGTKKNYPYDGKFRIVAQRCYRYSPLSSGSFNVFAEEHENILRLGLKSGQNWVPNLTAWSLGVNSQTSWDFNATTDPVR